MAEKKTYEAYVGNIGCIGRDWRSLAQAQHAIRELMRNEKLTNSRGYIFQDGKLIWMTGTKQ
jgi:hypothetical protein